MKTAIYATLFHSISTDQKPQHFKCPTGKDSWRFFQAALARGEVPGPHFLSSFLQPPTTKIVGCCYRISNVAFGKSGARFSLFLTSSQEMAGRTTKLEGRWHRIE
ncbi:uncharacterized protein TNCV_14601 [Trichonephila clavipes]|nr:uncharacterized protein TNCV_14601 [Trichonephila clavipes]